MIDKKTGEKRKAIMRTFKMERISSCDFGAQEGATMAIMKRRDVEKVLATPKKGESKTDFVSRFMSSAKAKAEFPKDEQRLAVANKQFGKRLALTTPVAGHSHMIIGLRAGPEGLSEVFAGTTSYVDGHEHSWVRDDAGNIIIAEADGHAHGIGVLVTKNELAEATASLDKLDNEAEAAGNGISKETGMSEETKAAPAVSTEDHEKVTKRAERAEAVVALPSAQREYFNKLEPAAQNEFLVLGPEQKDSEIAEAEAKDEIVYKSDSGEIFKASDDPRLVTMAKQADEDRKARLKAEKKAEKSDLAKRAESELAHTPGTVEQRSAMLKAVDGIEDAEEREAAMKALKAGDAALSKTFESKGDRTSPNADDDADTVITKIAKGLREKDSSLTKEQAYVDALETEEGSKALQAARAAERK